MKKQQVWRKMHKSFMPPDGVYQVCLVVSRYSQVPGIVFYKNSS